MGGLGWGLTSPKSTLPETEREKEFVIDNLLVRIHLIIEKIYLDRPCAIGL